MLVFWAYESLSFSESGYQITYLNIIVNEAYKPQIRMWWILEDTVMQYFCTELCLLTSYELQMSGK